MSFASPIFLWYFMPIVLAAVLLALRSWRNGVVAAASVLFYAVGAGPTTVLLLVCMLVNYVMGPALEPDDWELAPQRRRWLLIGVISFDLAVLIVWKYAGFASEQAAALASFTGLDLPTVSLALPIGISFYTFHHISYVVDVYRGERPALRDKVSFVAYSLCSLSWSLGQSCGTGRLRISSPSSAVIGWTTLPPDSRALLSA